MARGVAIIGNSVGAAKAALTLAELGIEVKLISSSAALCPDLDTETALSISPDERQEIWPMLLRAASHPLVTLYTDSMVNAISGKTGKFTVRTTRNPRYVRNDLCTGCNRCAETCSVQIPFILDGRRVTRSAIHAPVLGYKTIPSAYSIEKTGIAPCRAACPLGINVQGFISLISKGKADEALSLINERAPLAGVLGRVCTHPCQDNCKRAEVDSPVFIPALHRFAADNALGGITYTRKAPAGSRREKIAIVGSGPSGLAAAWELARRGYRPTIFESHAVVGGMVATGIPRFRLPREVRDREVEAIAALGVDIKTGVAVGRDVTISDLSERGYRAFFLAIGAHQNISLGIPGEDLEGVVDAVSLLFALNLKVGASVGENVAVIGGGNSAVDSARAIKRRSKGSVTMLYRRTAEEMTAVAEEVEEALKEGISIEYLTQPVEILGDGQKVTGIRCQRMKLGQIDADGRRRPEPIPGSEFAIDADHVVIAIGQRPNSSVLNIRGLNLDKEAATVNADPLTLETTIPGVFAGGDCVTGPNNVVEAVAAGLRAADSIDRYLRGRDMRKGRTLDKPEPVEVDINERDVIYHKRARMPSIPPNKRMGRFEEIALGLPPDAGQREAERCLNCALCSECLLCEQVCELGAVIHKDKPENVDISAEIVVDFTLADGNGDYRSPEFSGIQSSALHVTKTGMYAVEADEGRSLEDELSLASAIALEVATQLKKKEEAHPAVRETSHGSESCFKRAQERTEPLAVDKARIGVILCRCGGSISSVIDFNQLTNNVLQLPGVCNVQEISQACTKEGADWIAAQAQEWKLDRVVLAACRCCGLEQICFSCTDRRVMCQNHLSDNLALYSGKDIEFVNIREQCAWVHGDDPAGATRKATDIVSAGLAHARRLTASASEEHPVANSVLVLGAGIRGLTAAKYLAAQDCPVTVVAGPEPDSIKETQSPEHLESKEQLIKQLEEQGLSIRAWPQVLKVDGAPGSYKTVLKDRSQTTRTEVGAIILDLGEQDGQVPPEASAVSGDSRIGRIIARSGIFGNERPAGLREFAIKETAGIFVLTPAAEEAPEAQALEGANAAARALAYLYQGTLVPRGNNVTVDTKLCRGCGDCAAICSYIEMRERGNGVLCAYIDRALCLGCGVCTAHCPTGAITQTQQSDEKIGDTLEALLGKAACTVEAI